MHWLTTHSEERSTCRMIESFGGFVTHKTRWPFSRVNSVNLQGANLGDDPVRQFAILPAMTAITLGHTKITNAVVEHLTQFNNLSCLFLQGTRINDGCVPALSAMHSLRLLSVQDTEVTYDACVELSAANPNCLISHADDVTFFNSSTVPASNYQCWLDRDSDT